MTTSNYGLGRIIEHQGIDYRDPNDHKFPMRAVMQAEPVTEVPTYYYITGPVLDQGTTPHCVGYSWRDWLSTSPLMTRGGPAADQIYRLAQTMDEWSGENYDGSSVRGGVKALESLGHIAQYVWAFDAETVRRWICQKRGSVVVGSLWHSSMFTPDRDGYVSLNGDFAGGHAWHVIGYSHERRAFRAKNSWGSNFGQKGRFWVRFEDMDRLIKEQGEAVCGVERKVIPATV